MAGPEFFQTGMGRQFFESTVPQLVRQLAALNEHLGQLVAGAQQQQVEDERAAAAFAMRETIAHAIEQGFGPHINTDRDRLVAAIRTMEPAVAAEALP